MSEFLLTLKNPFLSYNYARKDSQYIFKLKLEPTLILFYLMSLKAENRKMFLQNSWKGLENNIAVGNKDHCLASTDLSFIPDTEYGPLNLTKTDL